MIARHVGKYTKIPSLVLGCEKSNPSVHKNYSMLYSSHISWTSPTSPTPLELYPALAFDRLFKDTTAKETKVCSMPYGRKPRDCVGRSALSTSKNSTNTCIRCARWKDVSRTPGSGAHCRDGAPRWKNPIDLAPEGIPQDIDEHMRLMCDVMVLGFQTDTTRVCTLKLNNDHSSLRFPHLGVDYMIHHLLSHSDTEDWLKVNQFFVSQLAYLCDRMAAIQEGGGTLLDHTLLLFCSSMLTGNHDASQLPVVLMGGGAAPSRAARCMTTDRPMNDKCVDSISRF